MERWNAGVPVCLGGKCLLICLYDVVCKGKACTRAKLRIELKLIPFSVKWSDEEYWYSYPGRFEFSWRFSGADFYFWVREALQWEQSVSPKRIWFNGSPTSRAQTSRSGLQRAKRSGTRSLKVFWFLNMNHICDLKLWWKGFWMSLHVSFRMSYPTVIYTAWFHPEQRPPQESWFLPG